MVKGNHKRVQNVQVHTGTSQEKLPKRKLVNYEKQNEIIESRPFDYGQDRVEL